MNHLYEAGVVAGNVMDYVSRMELWEQVLDACHDRKQWLTWIRVYLARGIKCILM